MYQIQCLVMVLITQRQLIDALRYHCEGVDDDFITLTKVTRYIKRLSDSARLIMF